MKKHCSVWTILIVCVALVGCSSSDNSDLRQFMDQTKAQAQNAGRIEPLPAYPPYVATIYSSAGMRSPFDPPRQVVINELSGDAVSAPDLSRPKEFLERFNVTELTMVGSIEKDGVIWALIRDSSQSVHRVKVGNFIGRNYGLITEVRADSIELIETVVNGQGGWIERPRGLSVDD